MSKMNLGDELGKVIRGEVDNSDQAREFYSHDASMFELVPEAIAYPKDTDDVEKLVQFVAKHKKDNSSLSLTARSAGTDMSGGAINDSIIIDFSKHFTTIKKVGKTIAHAQPGVFYRDFDIATIKHDSLMPTYPASRDLCTIGGMVNNNSGGEKWIE